MYDTKRIISITYELRLAVFICESVTVYILMRKNELHADIIHLNGLKIFEETLILRVISFWVFVNE